MPKDISKTLTSRSHLQSAQITAQPAGTDAGEVSQAGGSVLIQPPSQWRDSKVGEGSKLAKTLGLQQYRLKQEDIKGLPFEKRVTVVAGKRRDMYLYKERDIERKAWERYGGPEGFEAYLKTMYDKHVEAKGTSAPFVQPSKFDIPALRPRGADRERKRQSQCDGSPRSLSPQQQPSA